MLFYIDVTYHSIDQYMKRRNETMCTAVEIDNAVRDLQEYRRMKEQLDAEITAIEDLLKEF